MLRVVVVNESFVRKFFGNTDQAIGKSFSERRPKEKNPLLIVGVVKDAKHFDLHDQAKPIFYTPIFQDAEPNAVAVYIRTRQAPEDAAGTVRAAVNSIDSKLVVDSLQLKGAAAGIDFRDHVHYRLRAQVTEDPFDVAGDCEMLGNGSVVRNTYPRNLYGLVVRH